jgi:hypothetical protein
MTKAPTMKRVLTQFRQRSHAALCLLAAAFVLVSWLRPAAAQDIRGLEVCTAEQQMERRTGCLQADVDFLQQELTKLARQTDARLAAADRNLAAARTEIGALKSIVEKLNRELTRLRAKAEPAGKR